MKTQDIAQLFVAAAVCLCMSVPVSAAPQQDLEIPRGSGPSEDSSGDNKSDSDDDSPIVIRPGNSRLPVRPFQPPKDVEPESDQPIVLNARFAGWEGAHAKTDGKKIGDHLRGNWIMVDTNGRFNGTVKPCQGADVTNMNVFLMHMGRLVQQTTVDSDGRFSFNNVRQGSYALTGWGDRGMFTFGVNILSHNPNATENFPSNEILATAFQNQSSINTDWIKYYSARVGFRVFGRYPEGEGAKDSQALYGTTGLYNNLPKNQPATSISSHTVKRTSDGRLVGRVHQMNSLNGRPVDVRTTKVLLLENDSVVASTGTDNYGVFEFEQVPDGSYGVLAAGVDGVALTGITVSGTAADDETAGLIDFTLISSETIGWLNDYAIEVAYRRNLLAPRRPMEDPNQYGCPYCNNQSGGCQNCQNDYLKCQCRSRGITFEQWQSMGCQCIKSGFGEGRFIKEVGKTLRRTIDKTDDFYENAFGGDGSAALRNLPQSQGQNNYGYGNGYGYGYGYGAPPVAAPAPPVPNGVFYGQ
jgi:hypothetical protein